MKFSSNFSPANCFSGTSNAILSNQSTATTSSEISGLRLSYFESSEHEVIAAGTPEFRPPGNQSDDSVRRVEDFCRNFIDSFVSCGTTALGNVHGKFAIAIRNKNNNTIMLAVDRFASIPIFYAYVDSQIVFAESCSAMPDQFRSDDQISRQSLFAYLFFHAVPGPDSIYKQISKLPPASYLEQTSSSSAVATYWTPTFVEKTTATFSEQQEELHSYLERAVSGPTNNSTIGCFLSGGLDSSTILGYLSRRVPEETHAFSIGFDADGYDEISYARAVAKHFGAHLHEYYVTQNDIIDVIPEIASAYDQPFGNSSAVPTLYCARLASAKGIDVVLAGDGGDEIFAGNERYVKQKLFAYYERVPMSLRRYVLEPAFLNPSPIRDLPFIRKVSRYIEQAIISMPNRLETYNYLYRHELDTIFSTSFLNQIDVNGPLSGLSNRYWELDEASLLNRMLYLDWKFTLADNDLPKVTKMCQLAGIQVEFPFLQNDLVDFSTRVPSSRKLPGTRLRDFYRRSLSQFLPDQVLNKHKHGFGLPFGAWVVTDRKLRSHTYQSLARLRDREIFAPQFIDNVKLAAEEEHAAYYGSMLWVLMMLEEWLRHHH